jgi:hypothetical protein
MSICVELHNVAGMAHVDEVSDGSRKSVDIAIGELRDAIQDGSVHAGDYPVIHVIFHNDELCGCDKRYIDEETCKIVESTDI